MGIRRKAQHHSACFRLKMKTGEPAIMFSVGREKRPYHTVHQEEKITKHAAEIKLSTASRRPLERVKIVQPILPSQADKFSLDLDLTPELRALQYMVFSSLGDIFPPVKLQPCHAISNQLREVLHPQS